MYFGNTDTSAYTEEETLFFIRIKGKKHFFDMIYGKHVIDHLFGHIKEHHTISEYRNALHYIDLNKFNITDLTPTDYDVYYACIHEELPSIIVRCRGLREIKYSEAKELVLLTCKFFVDFFSTHHYRLFVIHIIDNYVLDVMCRVAHHMDIKVLCVSEWIVEFYRRHTLYGELIPFREPPEDEVLRIEAFFQNAEKCFWLRGVDRWNRVRYALYLMARSWVLYVNRYLIRYRLFGDRSYECRFANVWYKGPKYLFISQYFTKITEDFVDANIDRLIVVPLHYFPEANVDYWMTDYRHADYYTSLYEAVSFFRRREIIVLIKEHPFFLYQRDPDVYKNLLKYDNVRLIDPMSDSAALLDRVQTVMVWHGSMGIESLMVGKRVIAFDKNYYSQNFIPAYRNFEHARPLTETEQREFIRGLLRGVQEI